jgi:prepilin-type N-terminal cleavage/methylation domain-containing protein
MHATLSISRRRSTSSLHRMQRSGFTLVEVLTATALTLILMSLLAGVFASITDAVNTSRSTIELNSQLSGVAYRLQKDLEGYTVRPDPLREDYHDGYLAVLEGPLGTPAFQPSVALPTSGGSIMPGVPDTSLADRDDILMLTTRSRHEPFMGRLGNDTFTSEVAEVAWFLRGTTLYRRVLLVGNPTVPTQPVASPIVWWEQAGTRYVRSNLGSPPGPPYADASGVNAWTPANQAFYGYADLSVRLEGGITDPDVTTAGGNPRIVPNTLGDLSIPRNRYCYPTSAMISDVRLWSPGTTAGAVFGLPVLGECSHPAFRYPTPGGVPPVIPGASGNPFDQMLRRYPYDNVDPNTGRMSAYPDPAADPNNLRRINEDVIMTNVLGFDIKVWDPGAPIFASNAGGSPIAVLPGDVTPVAYTSLLGGTPVSYGAYVNLGYAPGYNAVAPRPPTHFNGLGDPRSYLQAGTASPLMAGVTPNVAVYDTYTNQYDNDGLDQDGVAGADQASNGFDDNAIGGIDDVTERELPPPYPFPLRGIQITIRVIEPDTQQIREIVVQQDFVLE